MLLPIERDLARIDAEHPRVAAAHIDLAAGDGGRAFEMDQVAGDGELPQGKAVRGTHATKRRSVGRVEAIAEDQHLRMAPQERRRSGDGLPEQWSASRPADLLTS